MSKHQSVALKVAVTLAILALIVSRMDFGTVGSNLSAISLPVALAVFVIAILQALVSARRLKLIVAWFGAKFRMRDSVRVTFESLFFNQTFVSFLGGDALRIWRIRLLGLPLAEATSATVLDRLIGIATAHVFLIASLPWLLSVIDDWTVRITLVLLSVSGVAGVATLIVLARMRGRGGLLHKLRELIPTRRLETLLTAATSVGEHLIADYRRLPAVVALSALVAIANMMMFGIILFGMGIALPVALGCALLVPAVLEISMIPISIAGWGLREGAAIVAFGTLGVPMHEALGCSLAFGLLALAVSLIGGVLWLMDRRTMRQIKIKKDATKTAKA